MGTAVNSDHGNCWASLAEAVGAATNVRSTQTSADTNLALQQGQIEAYEYNSLRFALTPEQQYVSHPQSVQAWMSKGMIASGVQREIRDLPGKIANLRMQGQQWGETAAQDQRYGHGNYQSALDHEKSCFDAANQASDVLAQVGLMKSPNKAFALLVKNGDTSGFNGALLNHQMTSVTVNEYQKHLNSLVKAENGQGTPAQQAAVMAAQVELGQLQADHQQATGDASQGVEAERAQVQQDQNMAAKDVALISVVVQMLNATALGQPM